MHIHISYGGLTMRVDFGEPQPIFEVTRGHSGLSGVWPQNLVIARQTRVLRVGISYRTCILTMQGQQTLSILVDLDLFFRSPGVILDLGGVWLQHRVNALQARVLRVGISYPTYILSMNMPQTLSILVDLDLEVTIGHSGLRLFMPATSCFYSGLRKRYISMGKF